MTSISLDHTVGEQAGTRSPTRTTNKNLFGEEQRTFSQHCSVTAAAAPENGLQYLGDTYNLDAATVVQMKVQR